MQANNQNIPNDILREAQSLAKANVQAEAQITEIYLAPSDDKVLLVEVDPTAIPNDELGAIPMYFDPEPEAGYHFYSGIVMVTPEEKENRIKLPNGWGDWDQLIPLNLEREAT